MNCTRRYQSQGFIQNIGIRLLVLAATLTSVYLIAVYLVASDGTRINMEPIKEWPEVERMILDGEEQPAKRLPQALIIGSRKSGTRALLRFLALNPNIRPAAKEVHFFDRMRNYKLGLDWYREQMPLSLANQITVEKSPAYFVTRRVPERIKAMNSSIKLILVVRNPVTRLISDFSQLMAHRVQKELGPNRDYDDYYHLTDEPSSLDMSPKLISVTNKDRSDYVWSRAEADFEDYIHRPDGGINENRRAIRASMYSNYLEQWLSNFGREQMHLVDGERLVSDPAGELRKVESFLGLKPVISQSDFIYSQTKGFYCLVARNQTKPEGTGRHKRESKEPSSSICLGNDKGRRHVKVKRNLIDDLQQFYSPFNEYLYSLAGKSFNWSLTEIK